MYFWASWEGLLLPLPPLGHAHAITSIGNKSTVVRFLSNQIGLISQQIFPALATVRVLLVLSGFIQRFFSIFIR